MKPIIGITPVSEPDPQNARTGGRVSLQWNYLEAITRAGGNPLIIPPQADPSEIAHLLHGWLVPGGDDIDAAQYGEANHEKAELQDPSRYSLEAKLYQILPPQVPILGICYGCQFINVIRGGSLEQHLPDLLEHDRHSEGEMQAYELDPNSKLASIVGSSMTGKSYHHQAVNRVGANLTITGKAEDGTVEALEATDRPWLVGVQWHPERSLEDFKSQQLFKAFVEEAARVAGTLVSR